MVNKNEDIKWLMRLRTHKYDDSNLYADDAINCVRSSVTVNILSVDCVAVRILQMKYHQFTN